MLLLLVGIDDPKTMLVANWNTQTGWTDSGSYPIGTPLTGTIAWDKADHQFISFVKVKGESGPGNRVAVPYWGSDTMPPVSPAKSLMVQVWSANCASAKTFSQAEVFFDNVITNAPLAPAQ